MHNYTLTVGRETEEKNIAYPFSFEATIKLPAREVWEQWVDTVTDHTKSWLWATQYSQPSVDSIPPRKGGVLTLTYQIPNPHDPKKPKKNATYEFDILEFDDKQMHFEYLATDDHPFLHGGGALRIKPIDENTCNFTWAGKYRHSRFDEGSRAQGDVFAHFLCMFFTAMAQNIKEKAGE